MLSLGFECSENQSQHWILTVSTQSPPLPQLQPSFLRTRAPFFLYLLLGLRTWIICLLPCHRSPYQVTTSLPPLLANAGGRSSWLTEQRTAQDKMSSRIKLPCFFALFFLFIVFYMFILKLKLSSSLDNAQMDIVSATRSKMYQHSKTPALPL